MVGDQFNLILLAACALIVAQSVYVGTKVLRCATKYQHWNKTTGVILRSKSRWERPDRGGFIFGIRGLGWFSACVLYSYTVDGVKYQSRTLLSKGAQHPLSSRYAVTKLKMGKETSVYYNPENASDAFLIPASRLDGIFMILIGVAMGILVLFGFAYNV
jgi:hypothetical protein